MQTKTQARAHGRALVGAVAIGSTLGFALGGAYLAGGTARAAMSEARSDRVAAVAAQSAALPASTEASDKSAAFAAALNQGHKNVPARTGFQKIRFDLAPAAKPFKAAASGGRDLDCLTTAVYYEARGEGSAGQAAVAQVVLNRVRHPAFPKSVCGVVYQGSAGRGCQFSFACNGAMRARKEGAAWNQARQVAVRAMGGFVLSGVGNATHFHATRVAPGWGGMVRVAQVGAHVFYRFGGRAGRSSAFDSGRVVASSGAAHGEQATSRRRDGEMTLAAADTTAPAADAPAYKVLGPTSRDTAPDAGAIDGGLTATASPSDAKSVPAAVASAS